MLKFLLVVNKQGHTRVSQYYEYVELEERTSMEAEITRKCLSRSDDQDMNGKPNPLTPGVSPLCPFMEFKNFKVVYRRYASLLFIIGVDADENELAILEFIHNVVETLDRYFSNVCELDILFNLDKVHMILDEMIMNGQIVETNKNRILAPVAVLDKSGISIWQHRVLVRLIKRVKELVDMWDVA